MKKGKIKLNEILEKYPNKYELAIVCGRLARKKFLEGIPKHKIMDSVFEDILNEER